MEHSLWPAEWFDHPAGPDAARVSVVYDPDMGAVAVCEWPDGRITTGVDSPR